MTAARPAEDPALVRLVTSLAENARAAALALATCDSDQKNRALAAIARLLTDSTDAILAGNAQDVARARENGLAAAQVDRLTLTAPRLQTLARSVEQVAALPDPVGEELAAWTRPNGLRLRKVRVPIGVIGIIYESRPNVTVDCAVLCLKSGNAAILRGGSESFHTNQALAGVIAQGLAEAGLPAAAVQLIPTTDRAALNTLLTLDHLVQCIIPRGGESLIRFVVENSRIPVIKHYNGVCFVYLDAQADAALAESITVNAKVSRPGVCNAAEQLLVHAAVAPTLLPRVAGALAAKGVELRCDPRAQAILAQSSGPWTDRVRPASPGDFRNEFLDLVIAVRIVDSLDEAIATINRDGSGHTDVIVTADESAARRFQAAVDSAVVGWNASTRFNDGFEFGFGAEIGISTDRLHARGPMGLPELCSYKYIMDGTGQIRG
jgi:glutamate-5-semialdehyde dehydrogenase